MPQLDPTWYASQLFWLCVSFFTLLFVMANFIAPKIADILARRQNKIDEYIDKAAETKRRAEESLAKYNEALSNATRESWRLKLFPNKTSWPKGCVKKSATAKPKSIAAKTKLWKRYVIFLRSWPEKLLKKSEFPVWLTKIFARPSGSR